MSAARRAADTAEQTAAEVEEAEKFLADLLARGEAVHREAAQNDAPEEKDLPAGATHEIHRDGAVKRRRYSAF